MSRRPKNLSATDEELAVELAGNLGKVVLDLLKSRGMTQSALAEALGYTRSSMNIMLHPKENNRAWRFSALCGLGRVFNVPVSALVKAAEAAGDTEGVDLQLASLSIALVGTEPRSLERLQEIIGEVEASGEREDVELFELGCHKFVADYTSGTLSDIGAFDVLRRAYADKGSTVSGKTLPLWAAVARLYN